MAKFCSPSSTGSTSGLAVPAAGPNLMALDLCKTALAAAHVSRVRHKAENATSDITADIPSNATGYTIPLRVSATFVPVCS